MSQLRTEVVTETDHQGIGVVTDISTRDRGGD